MLRIRSLWTGVAGSPYYTNMYFGTDNTSVEAQARATAVRTMVSQWMSSVRTDLTWNLDPQALVIDPATGLASGEFTVTGNPIAGTGAGDPLPPFTQLLARLNTPGFSSGRRIRGHLFIPGFVESTSAAGGRPTDGIKTVVGDALNNFIGTGDSRVGVWSRKAGTFTEVSGITVAADWAVLRSRRD